MTIILEPLISFTLLYPGIGIVFLGHIYLIVATQSDYALQLKLTTKLHHFHKLAENEHL
jgi:hypothetical protein